MITIIHGNDTASSRTFFTNERQKYTDAITLDADNVNITDLIQILEGGSLFGDSKHLFIEQLITKRKKSGDYIDIITYLEKESDNHTILLWENKELDISTQKAFKKALIRPFKLPQTLFSFLDNIRPHNTEKLIKLFHETIDEAETEMIFFMLVRQFRMMLALTDTASETIDEIKKLTWQKNKLQQQAATFEIDHLLALYKKLYAIEQGQKTGTLPAPLIAVIDFFLLEV